MSSFQEARDALARTIQAVFPDARPVRRWAGVEAWGAPRPEGALVHGSTGTYDPKVTVIGIAERKAGPVVYFLDPGDYFVLDTHRALLEGAGLKLGRGCIMHARKGPLPVDALERLFRLVKERDAKAAAGAVPRAKAAPAKKASTKKAAAKKAGAKAAPAKKAASRMAGAASSVDEYLAALPEAQRAALQKLRRQILSAAPRATEHIGYGMPTFDHEGTLVHMAAFRAHCSFFPGSAGVTMALAEELVGFQTAKGTIRFTPERPIPAALVRKIVKMRVRENEAHAAARRAKKASRKPAARNARAAKAAARRRTA